MDGFSFLPLLSDGIDTANIICIEIALSYVGEMYLLVYNVVECSAKEQQMAKRRKLVRFGRSAQ